MKLLLFCLFCFMTIGVSAQKIVWSKTRKLEWKDFKGRVTDSTTFAGTAADLEFVPGKRNLLSLKAKYTATAVFDSGSSFYRSEKSNDVLLEHEQLHFDIAAIYAIRLQQIFDKAGSLSEREAWKIFKGINDEFIAYQQLYDNETDHGTNTTAQSKWKKLVRDQLP
jgi:hypothetical protein